MNEKNKTLPQEPSNIDKIKGAIGNARYKLILLMLDEYSHLTRRQARRLISKQLNIHKNVILEIQNENKPTKIQ